MALTQVTPERDEYGEWVHPQVKALFEGLGDVEYVDAHTWSQWLQEHQIRVSSIEMDHDLDEEHPTWIAHFMNGDPGCAGWNPEAPGPDWHLLSIGCMEDGPIATFYRHVTLSASPASQTEGNTA